jgi:transcriptional regulator with XRE-family HTH domain
VSDRPCEHPSEETIDRFYIDVGRRIREARTGATLTQAQLASLAALTRSSVANIEAGRQRVPLHVLALIADALGIDPRTLFAPHILGSTSLRLSGFEDRLKDDDRDFVDGALAQLGFTIIQRARLNPLWRAPMPLPAGGATPWPEHTAVPSTTSKDGA